MLLSVNAGACVFVQYTCTYFMVYMDRNASCIMCTDVQDVAQ